MKAKELAEELMKYPDYDVIVENELSNEEIGYYGKIESIGGIYPKKKEMYLDVEGD